jgi:hypothetical protein
MKKLTTKDKDHVRLVNELYLLAYQLDKIPDLSWVPPSDGYGGCVKTEEILDTGVLVATFRVFGRFITMKMEIVDRIRESPIYDLSVEISDKKKFTSKELMELCPPLAHWRPRDLHFWVSEALIHHLRAAAETTHPFGASAVEWDARL